jgi:CRISPR-associated protein Csh1
VLTAVKALGEVVLKSEPQSELSRQLDDPGAGGRVTKVAAVTLVQEREGWRYFGVEPEDYVTDKKERYLYKKGSANGPDFSPTARLVEAKKTVPNKLLNWFKVLDKGIDIKEKERAFLTRVSQCLQESKEQIQVDVAEYRGSIPKKEQILLTLKLRLTDGSARYPGDWPVFRKLLLQQIREKEYRLVAEDKVCSVCGQRKAKVLGNASVYKFYTEDKIGFIAGGFDKKRSWRNFPLCTECREALLVGRRYVEGKLSFRFCGLSYYLIPHSLMDNYEVLEEVMYILEGTKKKAALTEDMKRQLTGDEDDILYLLKGCKDVLTLNFFFMKKSNAAERILLLVEDVLPSRLRRIFAAKDWVERLLPSSTFTFRTLRSFFAKSDSNKGNYDLDKYFLNLVHCVFKDRPVQRSFVLLFMMQRIRQEFVNQGYFHSAIRDALLGLFFLHNLNLIEMEVQELVEERKFENYFAKFGSTFTHPLKKGLFLLGVLTEMLRRKQYSEREATPFDKNLKSLKLTERDLKGLLPKVQNKLEEYGSFDKGKKLLAGEAAWYLLQAGDGWKLSVDELNFYMAAGMNLHQEIADLVYGPREKKEKKEEAS